ncbi:MAG: hypothetical protein GPOALKHO_001613 [Sodalis sp.]|nr:MAG: hypothetical protein GPOALKHO_001613 [Sodalis sp.]
MDITSGRILHSKLITISKAAPFRNVHYLTPFEDLPDNQVGFRAKNSSGIF